MALPSLFRKKSLPPATVEPSARHQETAEAEAEAFYAAANAERMSVIDRVKAFDWMHYEAVMQGGFNAQFTGEFAILPTTRIMKGLYLQEHWINACCNAVMRQFLTPRYQLKRKVSAGSSAKVVTKHEFLDYMATAGREVESPAVFTSNGVADLILGGNAYWYNSKDRKDKRRLPADRVEPVIEQNRIVAYRLMDKEKIAPSVNMLLQPEEVTHIKLPNPFTPHVGLSLFIACILPVLIDKYGLEYVVGFFLRGGTSAGIIQTNTTNADQLLKLSRTLMQAFGGRKNMHADKILPQGADWKGQSTSFRDIDLQGMFKQNLTRIKAATGCTNTVLGISEDVNRATALAEMELFWLMTILPLQQLWCAGIEGSALWQSFGLDTTWQLEFDNTHVPYLDDFDHKLEQDKQLTHTWTINERRERLGVNKLKDPKYDQLEIEIKPLPAALPPGAGGPPPPKALPAAKDDARPMGAGSADGELLTPAQVAERYVSAWKQAELELQDPSSPITHLFAGEFGAWEAVVLDNLKNKAAAVSKVRARGDAFATAFAQKAAPGAMAAYDSQMDQQRALKSYWDFRRKDAQSDREATLAALRVRAQQVVEGVIMENGRTNFVGYSDTAMDRVYQLIEDGLQAGKSLDDVASDVRQWFQDSYGLDENYPGQASNIVQTEYGSALSVGQAQFGSDLAEVADEMAKYWVSMDDSKVRDSHAACEAQGPITGSSDDVIDAPFLNGLRYPREAGAPASEVCNCRCTIRYVATKWKD